MNILSSTDNLFVISCVLCSKLIHPDLGSIDDVLDIIKKVSTEAPGLGPIDDVLDIIEKVSTELPQASEPQKPPSPATPLGRLWPETTDLPLLHPSTKFNFDNPADSIFKKIFSGMQKIFSSNFFPFMGMKTDGENGLTLPSMNQDMFRSFQPHGVSIKKRPPIQNQVFVVTVLNVQCRAGLLKGFLGGAIEVNSQIHGAAHGVADAILGGVSQVLHHHHKPPHRHEKPETVVVVVEDGPDDGPPGPGYGRPTQNGYDPPVYDNRPSPKPGHHQQQGHYGYGNQGQNYNQNGNWNHNNQYGNPGNQYGNPGNQYGNPGNQYGKPNNQYDNPDNQYGKPNNQYGNPNQYGKPSNQYGNPSQYGNQNNPYNKPPNQHGTEDHDNDGNFHNKPNHQYGNQNTFDKPNQGGYQDQSSYKPEVNKPFGSTTKAPTSSSYGYNSQKPNNNGGKFDENSPELSTKKPIKDDEYPLFVPLGPNDYVYGGDKIQVNAPKRETDNSKPTDEDEDLPLDHHNKFLSWMRLVTSTDEAVDWIFRWEKSTGKGQSQLCRQFCTYGLQQCSCIVTDRFPYRNTSGLGLRHHRRDSTRIHLDQLIAILTFTQKVEASGNLNLLLPTVRENQPKRKLFVSSKLPDKMNRPLDENDPLNNTINKKEYLSNDVYEDFNLDKNRTSENAVKPFQPYTPQSENVSAVKPVNVDKNYMPDIAILPKVSLDERSSFNGDQCPEGYAKVNGHHKSHIFLSILLTLRTRLTTIEIEVAKETYVRYVPTVTPEQARVGTH
ncbi:hypothetical protein HW555_006323 [Spodoptera exigua]|uniref:Uncharacterized protein n=1 Tax=Spodoptera exigua TaxID=7107 RepID=A0A835L5F1_SPOEX|nr:hypothetical protein HW555_006323 [Spodoptera exigua]